MTSAPLVETGPVIYAYARVPSCNLCLLNVTVKQGWRQGVCLGRAKCLATAARALKFWGGGGGSLRHIFSPPSHNFPQKYHNGVGVLSSWTWLTAELTSKNKNMKKKKSANHAFPPPPRDAAPGVKGKKGGKRGIGIMMKLQEIYNLYICIGSIEWFMWASTHNDSFWK